MTIPEGHPNGYAVALVQPTQDFGSLLITTSKAQLDYDKDKTADGTYEVPYTASYTMSDSLRNLFKEAGTLDNPNLTFTLTLELDKRLRGKEASDYKFTSPIFKAEAFTISGDGHGGYGDMQAESRLEKSFRGTRKDADGIHRNRCARRS